MEKFLLKLKNISKQYGDIYALENINLNIEKEKIYGVIGHNGAGKTTLMKVLLDYIGYEGSIVVATEKTKGIKTIYVPENIHFYDYLSGEQAIKLITEVQNNDISIMMDRFIENEKLINYNDREKLIKHHSKGNLRKLFILQSLSVPSDLLLLDEPFSGLDPLSVEKLISLINAQSRGNIRTVIINTHIFEAAKKTCDELLFIKRGRIIKQIDRSKYDAISIVDIFENE